MISIIQFEERYAQDVVDLVLHFQNDGTRPFVTIDDQPDLRNIEDSYIRAGGNFWIAVENDKLLGSIGLIPCSDEIAVLKKFFVYEKYQGAPIHLGQQLYATLLYFAKEKEFKVILLDTPRNTVRAHKFYERAGFKKVMESELPITFNRPYKECDFFLLNL